MKTAELTCHPTASCDAVRYFSVKLDRPQCGVLNMTYAVTGDLGKLSVPVLGPSLRRDGLWTHCCFEAFLHHAEEAGYYELNFAPSTEWACYRFASHRHGMTEPEMSTGPRIEVRRSANVLEIQVELELKAFAPELATRPMSIGPAAVIETLDGKLSYWAAKHPAQKPDFHHPDGFTIELEAALLD